MLQNNAEAVFWTREKGSHGTGAVAPMPSRISAVRRFRQTVYDAQFKVPDYAPDLVYYYIFPERFRNGDKRNDPKADQDRYQDQTVELHRNWNDRPWKPGTGDGSDAVYNNDFFGGDLAGIIDKLDYIRELGANAIDLAVDPRRAKRLAHRIRRVARHQRLPRVVVTSPLQRCAAVGRWLRRWGWVHRVDADLVELDFGAWDGRTWQTIAAADIDAWCADFCRHAPGSGEPLARLLQRAALWRPTGARCVVTHGGWLLARRWQQDHPDGREPRAADWPPAPRYGECVVLRSW